ncbi:MAG: arginyltransferase [Acidobacteriota bacterium]
MLEVIQEHDCVYLPPRTARMCYRLIQECPPERYQSLLERGWRRFGQTFFRPECMGCAECRSLRLDVDTFRPNRSMRRTQAKNRDLRVELRGASLTTEHLDLYDRYHGDMTRRRSWEERASSPEEYFQTFIAGQSVFGHELLYRLDGELVAVALVDVLPSALSAVYCFYAPEYRDRGLGVFSVLTQVELARRRGFRHVYLGYWIEGNRSMRYKARYRPHEILEGRPGAHVPPTWNPTAGPEGAGAGVVGNPG